ncbi:electron transfer flavoprotein subunit alpha/FixB family protein [Candidatus Magnetaquicoccus inordinatus]|uniref:electron transfer flavoprotein subunit alpha/FixB family protein n=1 Tax=Candidatus Magnetaquicoccus inordinatus TaxID=2496818 RepID=UPI00187D3469|nr:FAD-binding protein [Candidatus Magnetaquicoccus inordinatus]
MAVLLLLEPEWLARTEDDRLDRLVTASACCGAITLFWLGALNETICPSWAAVEKQYFVQLSAGEELSVEALAASLAQEAKGYSHILVADSPRGLSLLPRLAALLDRPMLSGVQEIVRPDTFVLPILSGHLSSTVQVAAMPICLAVQPYAFAPAPRLPSAAGTLIPFVLPAWPQAARLLQRLPLANSDRPDLACAKRVVAGGGGLLKEGSFALIEQLAERLGAAVGASRAAVDGGLVPSTLQIGQTGQVIAPDLYIGIGISGSIAHLAGIKQAKTIVAINCDPLAPLMQIADWSLQGDLYEIIPEWLVLAPERG